MQYIRTCRHGKRAASSHCFTGNSWWPTELQFRAQLLVIRNSRRTTSQLYAEAVIISLLSWMRSWIPPYSRLSAAASLHNRLSCKPYTTDFLAAVYQNKYTSLYITSAVWVTLTPNSFIRYLLRYLYLCYRGCCGWVNNERLFPLISLYVYRIPQRNVAQDKI